MLNFVVISFRIIVGLVFLIAGALKVCAGRRWFYRIVKSYRLTNKRVTSILSITLPYLEVILGGALILGLAVEVFGLISFILLLAFSLIIVRVHLQGKNVDCGCFGKRGVPNDLSKGKIVIRNLVLAGCLLPEIFQVNSDVSLLLIIGWWCVALCSVWAFRINGAETQNSYNYGG